LKNAGKTGIAKIDNCIEKKEKIEIKKKVQRKAKINFRLIRRKGKCNFASFFTVGSKKLVELECRIFVSER